MINFRFNFCNKIKADDYIRFIWLDHTHKEYPSYYSYMISGGKVFFDYIALCDTTEFRNNNKGELGCSLAFLLLHELEHMLNAYLTGDIRIVPSDFEEFVDSIIQFNGRLLLAHKEIQETFCDFFAIAATYGSEWHDDVVLNQYITPASGELIIEYMRQLINNVEVNLFE